MCVVGAGPAGLVLALLLSRWQIPCLVLEQRSREELRRRAGAGLIEHRTVRRLAAYGLAQPILVHGATNSTCEFRADGRSFVLDYAKLAGGCGHFIYPQHELVAALAEQFLAAGGEIRFGSRVTGVTQDDEVAIVCAVDEATGDRLRVASEFVAGCDGARSGLLEAIRGASVLELHHPFRWLALIAEVGPSRARTIYGLHRRGFAGQMRRGRNLTRYMLEISLTDSVDDWSDVRIWAELEQRLGAEGEPAIARGALVERDVLDLRVRMVEPMQDGRVYLVGDAAHLITPAGGKGMNLAIQDALELAASLRERYDSGGGGERLAGYSAVRLPEVWRAQEFSNWILNLLHARDGGPGAGAGDAPSEQGDFAYRLRRTRLEELMSDPQLGRWFAHGYAGVDP